MMNKVLLDIPEVITTQNLHLQMPKAGFGKKLHEAICDGYEDYIKWLNWPKIIPTTEILEEECRRHHADFILRECIRYIIIEKETDKVVGRCAFPYVQANWMIPQFGISYFIRKSKRSKGYATEAVHAMALLALSTLKAKKLEIHCDAENIASTKIPLKLGFTLEYSQKGGWTRYDGTLAELQTYSLFSEENLPYVEMISTIAKAL